jgi:hypothetical protein
MAKRNHRETQLGEAHWDAVYAAMEELSEKLESETSRCEQLTADAIRAAQPARKLSALDSGIEQWKKALCNSAVWYYHTSFKLVLNNSASRDQKSPADVAYDNTVTGLSVFLRINALDGEAESSDGRVRDFIRHACGDWRDVVDLLGDSGPFQLPSWAQRRGFGAKIAGWPTPTQDPNHTLSSEYAERFILDAQAKVTEGLLSMLSRARREARIVTGMRTSSSSQPEPAPTRGDRTLTSFDIEAGPLWNAALDGSHDSEVSEHDLLEIAHQLDGKDQNRFGLLRNLEGKARTALAEHNRKFSRDAIKTWCAAVTFKKRVGSVLLSRAVRRRFSRAGRKCRQVPSEMSAMKSRTGF